MKATTYLPLAAIAAGVVLAAKNGGVSGVGRCGVSGTFSSNKKLDAVLTDIYDQLEELGADEVRHYMREFPREIDYNLVQYGNLLCYYSDIRQMYEDAGYRSMARMSDDQIWETYKRQVGYMARTYFK